MQEGKSWQKRYRERYGADLDSGELSLVRTCLMPIPAPRLLFSVKPVTVVETFWW